MHRDLMTGDVFQDAFVGCRFPANVVFGSQTIDRNHDRQQFNTAPLNRNRPNGAGHKLCYNPAGRQLRQNLVQFSKPNERLTADDRDVQRHVSIDEIHKSVDQFFTLEVAYLCEANVPTQMFVTVRIAARTA